MGFEVKGNSVISKLTEFQNETAIKALRASRQKNFVNPTSEARKDSPFHIIRNGFMECDKGFVTLGRDMGKKIKIPVMCFLVKHKKGNVLIDTGMPPDLEKTWGKRLRYFNPEIKNDVANYLKNTKINYIINTHLHLDHCGNNGNFKNAEIIVQKEEYSSAKNPAPYQKYAYCDDFNEKLNYRIIRGNLDLFGDGTIKIIKTSGHTKGHQSVLLNVDGRKIFIAGDACYTSENLKYNLLPAILWNPDKIIKCYKMMRELENTQIIFGHEENKELGLMRNED